MRKKFSKSWKGSKQPRKQRKYRYNAPSHILKKFVSVNLSKELRKKYNRRNIEAVKGDTVKIMRGNFKGKSGKIFKVDHKNAKISIEGIDVFRKNGNKVSRKIDPSNLMITILKLEDKKRIQSLEKK